METRTADVSELRDVLELDRHGRPRCREVRRMLLAVEDLLRTDDTDAVEEVLVDGFLRGSAERYEANVAPRMRLIRTARFEMGTTESEVRHFCGESPRHPVELSSCEIAETPVTNDLFALLDPAYLDVPSRDRSKPVVGVTWFDAAFFAMWVGCRLPTEAEWEFACGAGASHEWCCEREDELARYAWYSENSGGELHAVATRDPNSLGLFDFHGNVWEWCRDEYDPDFYWRSPIVDPVRANASQDGRSSADRVTRGGSMHALAEMCRSRYRFHEPPEFWASDLGFRLARSISATDRRLDRSDHG